MHNTTDRPAAEQPKHALCRKLGHATQEPEPQMGTDAGAEYRIELRWLVEQLAKELDALANTPYPHPHRFLLLNLVNKLTRVALHACHTLGTPSPERSSPHEPATQPTVLS